MYDANDNLALLERVQSGDDEALDELVRTNMGLVKSLALRFTGRGADYEDLVQLGTIGMLKAARNFDFSQNTRFSTYAVPLILGEIKRFLFHDPFPPLFSFPCFHYISVVRKNQALEPDSGA